MKEGPRTLTWRQWAREEFLWPGEMLAVVGSAWAIWYGSTHQTWAGGGAWMAGVTVSLRLLDRTLESWRAWRREVRRG